MNGTIDTPAPRHVERWGVRGRTVYLVARRHLRTLPLRLGLFLALTAIFLAAAVALQNSLRFTERNAILVDQDPLLIPLTLSMVLLSVYLGFSAALSVGKEVESGTLELLLCGPVDSLSFLGALFVAHLVVYLQAMGLVALWIGAVSWLLNLQFGWGVFAAIVGSLLPTAAFMALGLLASVWGGRQRSGMMLYLIVAIVGIALQATEQVVGMIAPQTASTSNDPLLFVRQVLASISRLVHVLSPFAQFNAMLTAIQDQDLAGWILHAALGGLQALVLLAAAVILLEKKGVRVR